MHGDLETDFDGDSLTITFIVSAAAAVSMIALMIMCACLNKVKSSKGNFDVTKPDTIVTCTLDSTENGVVDIKADKSPIETDIPQDVASNENSSNQVNVSNCNSNNEDSSKARDEGSSTAFDEDTSKLYEEDNTYAEIDLGNKTNSPSSSEFGTVPNSDPKGSPSNILTTKEDANDPGYSSVGENNEDSGDPGYSAVREKNSGDPGYSAVGEKNSGDPGYSAVGEKNSGDPGYSAVGEKNSGDPGYSAVGEKNSGDPGYSAVGENRGKQEPADEANVPGYSSVGDNEANIGGVAGAVDKDSIRGEQTTDATKVSTASLPMYASVNKSKGFSSGAPSSERLNDVPRNKEVPDFSDLYAKVNKKGKFGGRAESEILLSEVAKEEDTGPRLLVRSNSVGFDYSLARPISDVPYYSAVANNRPRAPPTDDSDYYSTVLDSNAKGATVDNETSPRADDDGPPELPGSRVSTQNCRLSNNYEEVVLRLEPPRIEAQSDSVTISD